MARFLIRLFVIIMIGYAAALYVIPGLVLGVFQKRYYEYNLDQAKGALDLLTEKFQNADPSEWGKIEEQLQKSWSPNKIKVIDQNDPSLTGAEKKYLAEGKSGVRTGYYGAFEAAIAPLPRGKAVQFFLPVSPIDINIMYLLINVLIVAVLLICLFAWLTPHWKDLEQIRLAALSLGRGDLKARTFISPRSNISELANVFDEMAHEIEQLVMQQQDLLNAVSHELRTPLSRLRFGFALVAALDLPEEGRKRMEEMVKHTRELDSLINELLSYSQLQSRKQNISKEMVCIEPFLDSILTDFTTYRGEKYFELRADVLSGSKEAHLDPRLTARAIENLVSNAIRHCTTHVYVRADVDGSGSFRVEVEDDGEGISVGEAARVFEPFYRADNSRNRTTGGFGLGLAITKRAIECQGGEVMISKSVLGGAKVMIVIRQV